MKTLVCVLGLGGVMGWIGVKLMDVSRQVGVEEVARIQGLFRAAGLE